MVWKFSICVPRCSETEERYNTFEARLRGHGFKRDGSGTELKRNTSVVRVKITVARGAIVLEVAEGSFTWSVKHIRQKHLPVDASLKSVVPHISFSTKIYCPTQERSEREESSNKLCARSPRSQSSRILTYRNPTSTHQLHRCN